MMKLAKWVREGTQSLHIHELCNVNCEVHPRYSVLVWCSLHQQAATAMPRSGICDQSMDEKPENQPGHSTSLQQYTTHQVSEIPKSLEDQSGIDLCLHLSTSCPVALKASRHFHHPPLSFSMTLTSFHDVHPACVLSASTILFCHTVFGLLSSSFLQVSLLVLHHSNCLVLFCHTVFGLLSSSFLQVSLLMLHHSNCLVLFRPMIFHHLYLTLSLNLSISICCKTSWFVTLFCHLIFRTHLRHLFSKISIFFCLFFFIFNVLHSYSSTGFTSILYSKIFIFLWLLFATHISFTCMTVCLAFPCPVLDVVCSSTLWRALPREAITPL